MDMAADDRIREMERHFDALCAALRDGRQVDAAMMDAARVLADYIRSGQWLCDYERDERGELPADLKRGVLSQDALYDLLSGMDDRIKGNVRKGSRTMTRIQIIRHGEAIACAQAEKEAQLLYRGEYLPGDEIRFETDYEYAVVQVDQAVKPARVYLPERAFTFRLPLEADDLRVYIPGAFSGEKHLCSIRPDADNSYRNLARNPADQRGDVTCYPHATANVETRNESVFCARNTIDGEHIACGHGSWPFGSWGIGARTDAELTLDFGREVETDRMVLYLRADFPHDAYWIEGTVSLSDGAQITFPLEGIDGPQEIALGGWHRIRSLKLHKLVKCDNPSAFPSLRQIEVYGRDV
ncbi:MAG: DUF4298 domain-containing protein [Clostridia bacterium]|nr:DUF4298 domain-containing protein [Clostridia bacterium]